MKAAKALIEAYPVAERAARRLQQQMQARGFRGHRLPDRLENALDARGVNAAAKNGIGILGRAFDHGGS
jgi:hypothetical protein